MIIWFFLADQFKILVFLWRFVSIKFFDLNIDRALSSFHALIVFIFWSNMIKWHSTVYYAFPLRQIFFNRWKHFNSWNFLILFLCSWAYIPRCEKLIIPVINFRYFRNFHFISSNLLIFCIVYKANFFIENTHFVYFRILRKKGRFFSSINYRSRLAVRIFKNLKNWLMFRWFHLYNLF